MGVGYVSKQKINKLLDNGEISESSFKYFFNAAREFFVRATDYLLASCPFQEDILCNVTWIDFKNHVEQNFSSVQYLVHNYPIYIQGIDIDYLN